MSKSVLVVDDDKILSFLTVNAFKKSEKIDGIEVAYNGQEAMSFLENSEEHPDFILLDISMPVMDGFEFLEQYYLKNLNRKSKIAIYTSSIEEADKEKAKQYEDVIDFIVKPLSNEKLEEVIAAL